MVEEAPYGFAYPCYSSYGPHPSVLPNPVFEVVYLGLSCPKLRSPDSRMDCLSEIRNFEVFGLENWVMIVGELYPEYVESRYRCLEAFDVGTVRLL